MKTNRYLFGLALLMVGTMPAFSQVSNDNEDEVYKIDARAGHNDFVPGQVLVKFKDGSPVNVSRARGQFRSVNNSAVDAVLKEFGVETMDKLLPNAKPLQTRRKARAFNGKEVEEKDLSQLYTIQMKSARRDSTMMLVSKLKDLGEVEFAEPNYKIYMMGQVPNTTPQGQTRSVAHTRTSSIEMTGDVICTNPEQNPLYEQQWGIKHLHIDELWNKPVINKKRPVIAILDTGVDITHPDLADNIWTKPGTEDEHGYDFINDTYDIRDYNMHGTHVAGIAAACNNETGIVGANPQSLIMPITVMQSDGTGDIQVLVKGIQYAIDNGADIINMSLGTYADSYVLRQILEKAYQNSILVASAGNDNKYMTECKCGGCQTMYPAGYSFVLGVQSGQEGIQDGFSNKDCNGPTYSEYGLDVQENYELIAPGTNIVSTIPFGNYKTLNGTSMSAPLVAGGISALKMVKNYDTQEILWGDLIHMDCNFIKVYDVEERPADIEVIALKWNDSEDGGNDDTYFDAGETVRFYPIIRTVWGEAHNIKCHLEMGDEYEDANLIEIIQNDVDFGWDLSSYAYETSKNPVIFKISENCADARQIKLKLTVTCDEAINSVTQEFVITVDNIVKLEGIISDNRTLTSNHHYLISDDVAIVEGATLSIEPGTNISFRSGKNLSVYGELNAHGEPGKMITLSRHVGDGDKFNIFLNKEQTLSYCWIKDAEYIENQSEFGYIDLSHFENCIIQNNYMLKADGNRCNFINTSIPSLGIYSFINSNFVNNIIYREPSWSEINKSNYINNISGFPGIGEDPNSYYVLAFLPETPSIDRNDHPGYLGTARSDLVIPHIKQMGYQWESGNGYGTTDLSNMLTEPVKEAHGVVWKVLVDGIDPQDEFEIMPTLGVGKHKFEVYFNRPMNKNVIPNIAFGVRSPYSQNAVDEDGMWNEEGTIYTAYKTITGKTQSDGRNRIYVWGAEDDEFFECPYENFRFNIDIQSAGSQSTGFMGEAGLGRVELDWENAGADAEDVLGYNIYRYTTTPDDSIRVNEITIDADDKHFTDYDIKPGTTYYYKYKTQNTDLREFQSSNVVAVTPKTAKLGDVTGNNEVDVFDVVYEVNYIIGQKPKAFVKCAADVNEDNSIDILDVQGIINTIIDPSAAASRTRGEEAAALYTIEDGVLYVESPVALGGVQVQVNVPKNTEISTLEDLKGFEQAGAWLSKNDYLFLAYNMKGKTLSAGKHALLKIGNGQVTDIRLGDAKGILVKAVAGSGTTSIDNMGVAVQKQQGIYNLKGQKVAGSATDLNKLPKGIYIIEGTKVLK